jgi:D-3-phosphoglycerate dehydrogenase
MKILVADKISPKGVAYLRAQKGFEVVEAYGSSPAKVLELVKDVHAIAVRSETKITAEVIAAAPLLKVVGRAGVGVDNVDVDAATERGVIVMNTPSGNTVATAELLFKKTLGIVGLGRIGSEVAKRAQAFGMTVIAYDPYLSPVRAKAMQIEAVTLDELLAKSDYITVHMPLTEQTQYMIDEAAFAKCKKGVRIFNCARGGIIKESALIAALKSGQVAAAGLDVFEEEPLAADSELRKFPNVTLTPHLGASTAEAQDAVGVEVAEQIADVLAGGVIRNAVNMPALDAATLKVIGPYLELGNKLGTLVQQLATDRVEKLRITYWGKLLEIDSTAVIRAIQRGFLSRISGESLNYINAPVVMERLGVQVEVVKSTEETNYNELMLVEGVTAKGEVFSARGTLLGKSGSPRIVALNGREVEATPSGVLLVYENHDEPGIIGMVGTLLGRDNVNIAAMSLGRSTAGGIALCVVNLDSAPSEQALKELTSHRAIKQALVVNL